MRPVDQIPPAPLNRGYRAWNPFFYAYLRTWDAALARLVPRRPKPSAGRPPRRILVANTAHLGDLVLATCVLPALKSAYPEAEIGFLCGGWNRPLLKGHPLLARVHTIDHWRQNRDGESLARKIRRYLRTRWRAIAEIRTVEYDAAIDLYSFLYPNVADALWASEIPLRIGYTSGGFGAFYSHRIEWRYQRGRHISEYHADLLRALGVGEEHLGRMRPMLASPAPEVIERIETELRAHGVVRRAYIVMHVGTGNPLKEWPAEKWRELARRLRAEGHRLVFTGRGERERRLIESIAADLDGCLNLCDAFDLHALAIVIEGARLVVAQDSAAAHLAAAVGTPSVAIWTGINSDFWRPMADNSILLTHSVPCSPCFLGCPAMDCVKEVAIPRVFQAIEAAQSMTLSDQLAAN